MSTNAKPAIKPTSVRNASAPSPSTKTPMLSGRTQGQQFVMMATNMSWQLALVVLLPVLGGVALGNAIGAKTMWVLAGVAVAFVGVGLVMWRTMQIANRLPVPKLTEAERRKIRQSYEEDDD